MNLSTCQGLGGEISVVDTGQVQPLGEQGSDACDSQPRCSHGSLNSRDSTHQNESKECRGQQRGCSSQHRSGNEASSAFHNPGMPKAREGWPEACQCSVRTVSKTEDVSLKIVILIKKATTLVSSSPLGTLWSILELIG